MKGKIDLKLKEDEICGSLEDGEEADPVTRGKLDAIGFLLSETDPITNTEVAVPQTDEDLNALIAILKAEKEGIAEYSYFGDPNWEIYNAQIEICEWAKGGN